MLFNSYIFVLLFLPLCIYGWFFLNRFSAVVAEIFLLGMSLWFYGYFNIKYLPIIIISIIFNYTIYMLFKRHEKKWVRQITLMAAILFNVGILFYFKYFDFFITNINSVFHTSFVLRHLLLPLGISFFTFQQLSFVIDAYRKEIPDYNFLNYALFVTYFPQLIAGPIVTHDELVPQFADIEKKKVNWDNLSKGLYIFALGMGKKVLIADTFGNAANWGFSNIGLLDTTNAFIVMLSYTIQIYFDFSGYCDMATGIAKMMNIDLPLNFNSPYKALTIIEFWDRWHMTLTRFFTRYIYIPLGGSRKGETRTYVNTMIVFLVSGLWHGANWTFVLWGVLHGVFSVITKYWKPFFEKLHPALNWLLTFGFVNAAWVLFRADSIRDAMRILYRITMLQFGNINSNIVECFNLAEFKFLFNEVFHFNVLAYYDRFFFIVVIIVVCVAILASDNLTEKMERFLPTARKSIVTVGVMVWCILSFSGISTFLYFNF